MIDCDWRRTYGHAMCLRFFLIFIYIVIYIGRLIEYILINHKHTYTQTALTQAHRELSFVISCCCCLFDRIQYIFNCDSIGFVCDFRFCGMRWDS